MTLMAKEDESLLSHSLGTLNKARHIAQHLNDPDLKFASFLAAALHDMGKADNRFQKYLLTGSKKAPPHPILSLPIAKHFLSQVNIDELYMQLIILAIASHHSPLKKNLYQTIDEFLQISIDPPAITELNQILERISNELNVGPIGPITNVDDLEYPVDIFEDAKYFILDHANIETRKMFTIISGTLMASDFFASAHKKIPTPEMPKEFVKTPYDYQLKATKVHGNLFITLPTGSGKTETALYWASSNFQNKLFYVLPTTTTINAMYLRLKDKYTFNRSYVGLYHSYVDIFMFVERSGNSEDDILYFKYFLYPISVTTPDQLILALLNHKRYTLKNHAFLNSTFIFDEIHTYDAETFFLIKYLLKYLQDYNVRVCVMSATFPSKYKEELSFLSPKELLPLNEVIHIYKGKTRTVPRFFQDSIFNHINEIVEEYRKGKKVLVVLNTVKRAQEMYRQLKEQVNKILLFHSRFTFGDKIKRERKVTGRDKTNEFYDKPHILVATQVVEVSLDVDYDVMFTEAAYPDSIIQRAGRVNRRNKLNKADIYIFTPEKHFPYEKKLLEGAMGLLEELPTRYSSEWNYVELTNEFYDLVWDEIKKNEENRYERIWRDYLEYIFSADLSDRQVQELLKTRSGIITIPAIPYIYKYKIEHFFEELKNLRAKIKRTKDKDLKKRLLKKKREKIEKIKLNLVNVPIFYKAHLNYDDNYGLFFVSLNYNYEFGLTDEMDNMI